jgi:hypothetical protein
MYFTGSPFESPFDSADLEAPPSVADSRRAGAKGRRSAAHSAACSQWGLGAIRIRDDGFVRPIIGWKLRRMRCLFRGVARKGNGASIYRAVGRQ